ncbi:hypothetical protein [Halorientalis litorea]|jgi:hypothetical protein|uniref:hypothetical protein n=1 Tax=Halorientalis litorea TaxID=2931977 RepID=UPI001FF313D6|nr:hypothetical protein [Halorientalis litorea]
MADMGRRERVLWVLVFALPPGVGITGYVSVMFERGALTPRAVAAGLLTAVVLGSLVGAALFAAPGTDAERTATGDPPDAGRE